MSVPLAQLAKVVYGKGDYSSKFVSQVERGPGEVFAEIEGWKRASGRDYTTVQISDTEDIDLNSDLVYCNHSCDPNVAFDMKKFQVRVLDNKSLKCGDDITFFYPSTEWHMQQPFDCNCGASTCLGSVTGAKDLDEDTLSRYWLNPHIEQLLAKKRKTDSESSDDDKPKMVDSVMEK